MPNATPPQEFSPLAALLSYLVPGMGQIYQGRIGKGVLFFVCIYGLFFYGMKLGSWSNVYLPDTTDANPNSNLPTPVLNLYNRPQFLGQVWVGAVAWPALWQYLAYDPKDETGPLFHNWMRAPFEWREGTSPENRPKTTPAPANWPPKTLNELQTDGDKSWDLAWVYTVIAGVLNIMVIYDAYAGPAFATGATAPSSSKETKASHADAAPAAGS